MTLESCASFCSGYVYFGTEYSSECYCGNSLASSSAPAPLSDCSMTCSGNPYEYCGAGNRLELYKLDGAVVPSGPTQPATVSGNWSWVDCYTEGSNGRALSAKAWADDGMTLEKCGQYCQGYRYFGAEYARECYCGDGFGVGSVKAASQTECGMTCKGNGTEYCGAGNRLSVYENVVV